MATPPTSTLQNQDALVYRFLQKINQYAESMPHPYTAFGLFGVITYPLFFLIWHFSNPTGYENLWLRLIATGLCLPLVFHRRWPKRFEHLLPSYWYLTVLYCLPFLFTFLLLKNNDSPIWALNTMSILALCVLLLDPLELALILPIGTLLGWLCYWLTTDAMHRLTWQHYQGIFITYFSVIVFGSIFSGKKTTLRKNYWQYKNAIDMSASVAHELRTPLRAIAAASEGIRQYLPALINTYQLARQAKLSIPYIPAPHMKTLLPAFQAMENETQSAFTFIDMLLMNVRTETSGVQNYQLCQMRTCIEQALARYPLTHEERAYIEWQHPERDFCFSGDETLMVHVLFNLLKNALYAIKSANKPETERKIIIEIRLSKKYPQLCFKDTGTGISPKVLPHIFERFFTRTRHGTGIGLAFCKMVIENFGGTIECHSILGQQTEFILQFSPP